LDGSVSYGLEWNGLKFVFGGDTYPNKWYIEYAKDADVASHELFAPPELLAEMFGWDMTQATWVATRIHTSPGAFGKVMSAVNPRLAVGYHSIQDIISTVAIADGVRETYDGNLAIATDLMVINVTKDNITVRLAIVDENVNPPGAGTEYMEAKRTGKASPSEFINEGKWKDYTPPPMPKN
jgi:ribonuclease Z